MPSERNLEIKLLIRFIEGIKYAISLKNEIFWNMRHNGVFYIFFIYIFELTRMLRFEMAPQVVRSLKVETLSFALGI